MRILQINASYKPAYIYGGPTMSVSKLSEELFKVGIDLEVITTTANGTAELDVKPGLITKIEGVPVRYFKRISKDPSHFSPTLLIYLWKTITKNSVTSKGNMICHIHAWWNLVSVGACAVAILASCPVIISPRGNLSKYSFGSRKSFLKNIFHKIIGKNLLKRCHFHVTSVKEKQDILAIVQPKSITIIPNFVNLAPPHTLNSEYRTDNFRHGAQKEEHRKCHIFKLIFLSRIEEKKGLDILFIALKRMDVPYHLTIAGTGKSDYITLLKSLAAEINISEKISWIGHQHNEQKFPLLAAHDLLVLPSHDENFANVVIESLSVGTPVLLSKKVGLADYVSVNNFGWVCDNSYADFKKALQTASQEKEKRTFIRNAAPNQINLDFDVPHLLTQYIHLYQNTLLKG